MRERADYRRIRPDLRERGYTSSTTSRVGKVAFVLLVVILIALAGLIGGGYWSLHSPQGKSSAIVPVHVQAGDTVNSIADQLQSSGIINNSLLFRLDARLHGLGGNLKMGDYAIRRNMSIDQMVSALLIYHQRMVSITIPEGLRIEQIEAILRAHHINVASFLKEVQHPTTHQSILAGKPKGAGLEGYLFPSTYEVPPNYPGKLFADMMVKTLGQEFTPVMRAEARRHHLSPYKVLTLASIVEREDRVPHDRPIIASVYLNRLRIGMALQADPTVQYVVGTSKDWWPVLATDQLQTPGAYNTYVHRGLPPGPIANPGLASIRAVVYPAHTKYLYFVAKPNGQDIFAETYAEQLQHEAQVQQP
ncbi:MAG TPA: endolytic transglycosylase MltG [Chloroflexota bacterium]|nr:endolytic transglycosylase MltG [Chloroflexota bacterium]